MKSCFGYIRVSTQKQGEGVSLEAQKDAITAFASRNNLAISNWFEEKETAAKSGRPVFGKMIKLLENGIAQGLVIHKIDRSARNLKDWAVISDLSDAGVDVYFATESLDFRSRGGRLTADIQAVIAADYIRNLREETIKGMQGRLKQGLFPFRAPLGYVDNGRGQPKTPCPVMGPLVTLAFREYATGNHSICSLRDEMTKRGLRNHARRPLSQHGVEAILRNTFYCGLITIRRNGQTFRGTHQPLIDSRTFQRVQDIKAGKAGKKTTRHNQTYRGLFRCGHCEGPMSPELQKANVYYRCHTRGCPTKSIREEDAEQALQSAFQGLTFTEREIESLVRDFALWKDGSERNSYVASLELRKAALAAKVERLTDLLIEGKLPQSDFDRRRQTLALEEIQVQEELESARRNDLEDDELQKYFELLKTLAGLYRSAKPDEKRILVRNCFSNRTVRGKNVELEPHNWFLEARNCPSTPNGDPDRPTSRTDFDFSAIRGYVQALERFLPQNVAEQPIRPRTGFMANRNDIGSEE